MSSITLKSLRHSYLPNPQSEEDYALRKIDLTWRDGGAFALLGPSGCGKTTLLNLISGLLKPSEGQILFDERDVTLLPLINETLHKSSSFLLSTTRCRFTTIWHFLCETENYQKLNLMNVCSE